MGNRLSNPAKKEHYWYKALLWGLFFSAAVFIPYIVIDHGYFLYYGDFNVQQVPFYQLVHDAIRNGEWGWTYKTDLGSSLIGSYTFYLLGSPYFWLTIPFPSEFVPYLMGPLLILKFGTASLTGYIYLRRYTRNKNHAVIGGVLYAFSGFSVYNVFFNHFHEAIVVFPLLLAAIDEYMYNKRRGVVALAVFASCIMNYYFFVGMVSFVIIYWFLKTYMDCWRLNFKEFVALAFEVVVGFAATAILLVPTVLFVTQNPRLNDYPLGWETLVYSSEQRYVQIIASFFFPPDIPARPNFAPDCNSKWASVAAWLPVFGMTGVIGFIQSKSKGWLKKLLPFLLLCTVIPILNAIFQMFIMTYYARWFFMLTLMMVLATLVAIENPNTNWKRAITWNTVVVVFMAFTIGLMPNGNEPAEGEFLSGYGLEKYPDRFWIYAAIAIFCLALVTLLARTLKVNKKTFYMKAMACLGVVCVLYSGYVIGLGKSHSYDIEEFVIPYALNNGKDVELDDLQNVRSDFYETMDNMGMFWQIPTIQAFQSIVPGSVYDFYPSVGVPRDVGSRPETKYYGIRGLLSVKYLFDYAGDSENFENEDKQTRMPGYTYVDTQNGYKIYDNNYYIPYGFYYDSYITTKQYDECEEDKRHLLLLKAMVLDDEQAAKYGDLMTHITDIKSLVYTDRQYKTDCKELQDQTCSSFEYGNSSFNAKITLDEGQDRLVFFSVPYESGWSATVNGAEAEIERVNVGFMAVRVKGGETSEIVFTYKTPGVTAGICITGVAILMFVVYMIISKKKNLIKPRPKIRKSYKVSAFGPAYRLDEKYRNLKLGSKPMKKYSNSLNDERVESEADEAVNDSLLPTSGVVNKMLEKNSEEKKNQTQARDKLS
ncbi:MAG: YfhO family protein, partial [Lachnospiraceae bacterium]|nr:YfhO family protein [Lachnospiraceae bacterium]